MAVNTLTKKVYSKNPTEYALGISCGLALILSERGIPLKLVTHLEPPGAPLFDLSLFIVCYIPGVLDAFWLLASVRHQARCCNVRNVVVDAIHLGLLQVRGGVGGWDNGAYVWRGVKGRTSLAGTFEKNRKKSMREGTLITTRRPDSVRCVVLTLAVILTVPHSHNTCSTHARVCFRGGVYALGRRESDLKLGGMYLFCGWLQLLWVPLVHWRYTVRFGRHRTP